MSGFAFVPWFVLALFTAPLLRVSLLMSADLPYAAAFLTLFAHLVAVLRVAQPAALDVLLGGLSIGLLLGTKTTAAPAAAILLLMAAIALSVRAMSTSNRSAGLRPSVPTITASLALSIAAGGVWLLRNWLNYGSPVAPVGVRVLGFTVFAGQSYEAGKHHLSALSELEEYGALRFWLFAKRFLREWMGWWFPQAVWLVAVAFLDAVLAWRAGHDRDLARLRAGLIAAATIVLVALTALLLGAPWTSLLWTRGRSLRYILPALIVIPFLAFLIVFPVSWPWYRGRAARLAAGTALVTLVLAVYVIPGMIPPRVGVPERIPLAMPAAGVAGVVVLASFGVGRFVRRRSARFTLAALAILLVAWIGGSGLAARDARLRTAERRGFPLVEACPGDDRSGVTPHRICYLAILRYERLRGITCSRRRIFTATRFDSPLDLQSFPYQNIVLDAQAANLVEREIALHGPGTQPCDYIIASKAQLKTVRGSPVLNRARMAHAVVPIGDGGSYEVFAVADAR